jgi:hypothetical protein
MAKLRKRSVKRAKTLDDVVAALPARFLSPRVAVVAGTQVGLREFMADLEAHVESELGRESSPKDAAVVMGKLGIDPHVWLGLALGLPLERIPANPWRASE